MRRLFITGGSGFIGGEVVRLARRQQIGVCIYDIAKPDIGEHCSLWVEGDVRDARHMSKVAADFNPTHVLHLASDTDVSITELHQFTTTIDGTGNVVELVKASPSLKKFVHVSTQFVVKPGILPASETTFEPYTTYGAAKAETEKLVREASLKTPWLIARPTIIWGPRHPSFAANIFRHMAKRYYMHPEGSSPITRAFGYVENAAHQLLALTLNEHLDDARRVYYVGDSCMDYGVWADAFSIGLTGKKARRIPVWMLKWLGGAGDVLQTFGFSTPIDSGRAFRMCTSSQIDLEPILAVSGPPPVSFEEGVRKTLDWLGARTGTDFSPPPRERHGR